MATAENIQAWSKTAASNSGADSTIGTYTNATAPNTVDDKFLSAMAAIAKYADDTGGQLVVGGTATALTVTTNQVLSSGHITDGLRLCVRTAAAATGAATIAVDGLSAVTILKNDTSAIVSGDWAQDAILDLVYSSADSAFIATNISPQSSSAGTFTTLELGHASDTTLARASAGVVTVEGNRLARIYTGTYTGDGTTSKSVTGVGFAPKYVKIWQRETSDATEINLFEATDTIVDDIATGASATWSTSAGKVKIETNQIIAFGADGFTVDDAGSDEHPNTSGQVYNFMCLG